MKKRIFIAFAIMLLVPLLSVGQTKTPPMPGSDRDTHGCIPSAGYSWSNLKKECIRTFEQDIRLIELNPKGSSTSEAAVILSKDKKKAEVFMKDIKGGLVLNYNAKTKSWKKGDITLTKTKGYTISKGKTAIYGPK